MKVYVNKITGIDDAIVTMFMSKRNWSRELEEHIRSVCKKCLTDTGMILFNPDATNEEKEEFMSWLDRLVKWGWKHITLLRFIDISVTVEGLHRAGQDDWDSHAKRFDNRIIRESTRLATFGHEMSDYYKGKILPMDEALNLIDMDIPQRISHDGSDYVRTINGYIREDLADNKDVKRGLYMLSIPSNFIFKVNLTEWSHVYKERNASGHANPEVKECCEAIADQIEQMVPQFNRELFFMVKN